MVETLEQKAFSEEGCLGGPLRSIGRSFFRHDESIPFIVSALVNSDQCAIVSPGIMKQKGRHPPYQVPVE